ncbi:hypothetical protein CXK96_02425 [Stutzerimonas stutzeri]|nr:hypothetical protein CXK96_02425 [Stutzerimonas stutzeri]
MQPSWRQEAQANRYKQQMINQRGRGLQAALAAPANRGNLDNFIQFQYALASDACLCYKTRRSAGLPAEPDPTHVSTRYPGCSQELDIGTRGGLTRLI